MIQILKCGLFVGIIAVSSVLSGVNSDCMSPPSYENTEYEILVPKTSPVESTAVYFCKSGFSMLGDADYIVLVCRQDEEWIGPKINCTNKVGCGSPPFPAYGSFLAPSEDLVYGTNISMTCDEGYVLEGANKLTCSESGAWTTNVETTEVPVCIKECSEEESLYQFHECYEKREGSVVWEGARSNCETTGGQLATIKDAYRQTFIQNLLRSQPGAYWIGGLEVRGWKYPSDGQYANYFNWAPGEPNYGHEHCVYLSNLHGVENAHKWNDETCSRSIIEVNPPMMIYAICEAGGKCENISTTFNHLQYQEKCIIFLDDSPRDQSSATTKCKDDFNGTLVEIRNEKLQKIIENFIDTNMSVIANWWIGLVEELNERTWEWVDGERITQFFWGVGEPNGVDEHCLDLLEVLNYAWNDNNCQYLANYICQYGESKCGNPGSPSHGNMTVHKDSYFIGESVAFSCDSGYVLNDSSLESMTCENDTTWSGNIPVCERVNCSETVPNVANAMYTIYSTSYRGVVVYQCDIGHVLSGYPVSVCQEDGTWTVPGVTCIGPTDTIGITTLGSGISTITISTAPKRTSFTASTTRRTTMDVTAGQTSNTGTENKITGTVTEPTKSNTGLIIGISLSLVGIIIIVIVVIIVVLLLDRRRKSMSFDVEEKHEEKHEGTPGMYHNPAYVTLGPENNSKEKDDKRLIGY